METKELQPINCPEKVDLLIEGLLKGVRSKQDLDRAAVQGLNCIRSVKMQLYFKTAFEQRIAKRRTQLPDRNEGHERKSRTTSDQAPLMIGKKPFLLRMIGKPLTTVAGCADVDVRVLVRVLESHGHVYHGRRTALELHMIPWFLKHLPDQVPDRSRAPKRKPVTAKKDMFEDLPKEIQGPNVSQAYGREGDYRRLIHTRSKY